MGRVPGTGLLSNFLTTFRERPCVGCKVSLWCQQLGLRSWLRGWGALHAMLGFSRPQCILRSDGGGREAEGT